MRCRSEMRPVSLCPQELWEFLRGIPCPEKMEVVCTREGSSPQERRDAEALSRAWDALANCARLFGATACYR